MICRFVSIKSLLLAIVFIFPFANNAFAQLAVTGIVRAEDEVVIKSELSGLVQKIAVKEGDRVLEGQLMVELENEHQKINLELSRTGLTKAKAAVEETTVVLENAQKEAARVQIAANALPRKELEDIRDQVLRLKASLAAQVADVARAEQEVKLREQELKDTQILAPFAGTITEIFIHRGESLRPIETPVLQIVGLDVLYAELRLPSSYVRTVQLQQPVKVQVEGEWMGRLGQIEGRVTYINPTIDAASRTFKIKVGIPASKGLVRPGMLVEARF
jgi:membrane fusion protein, multidrug efflux system